MYTVIRFVADSSASDEILEELGMSVNTLIQGAFKRLDHAGGRFSISVSSEDDWDAHMEAIARFVRQMSGVICEAKDRGVSVVVDIAIEPEDVEGKPYFSGEVSTALLQVMARHDVRIGITVYGTSS